MNNIITTKRIKKGWSIRQLSRESGVSVAIISRLENGTNLNTPSGRTLIKLANALGIAVTELFKCLAR